MAIQILCWDTSAVIHESDADLRGKAIEEAVKANVSLFRANLQGANLQGANLQGANLQGANLRGADLQDANLQDANLQDANLQDANLQGANLRGADLQDACMETGERWETYCTETLPAFIAAGGKTTAGIPDSIFQCHGRWDGDPGCLVAWIFDTDGMDGVPVLHRPRAEQAIRLFDAKLLDEPLKALRDATRGEG